MNGDLPDGIVQVEVKIDDIAYIHLMRKDEFGIKSLVEPAGLVLQLVLAMLLVGLVLGI